MPHTRDGSPGRCGNTVPAVAAGAAAFLATTATTATTATLAGAQPASATAAGPRADTVASILQTALLAEKLSAALYYAGLTTPSIIRSPHLAGRHGNALNPGLPPGGNPPQVRYLQAALDAEVKHMEMLSRRGAQVNIRSFYVPAQALQDAGSSATPRSYFGTVDDVETLSIGLYLAAVGWLTQRGETALALLAGQLAAVDAEHRMLGRAISGLIPANNLTLEREPFGLVSDARAALQRYVTGQGIQGRRSVMDVPTAQQAARVVGKYGTRLVRHFL